MILIASIRQFLRQRLRAVLATAAVAALSLAGLISIQAAHAFGVPQEAQANPFAGSAEAARKGEELFGRNCQQCHNTRGHGGKCPQLVRGAWGPGGANSDAFMFETISNGRPNTQMGAFGKAMSAEEIWQIVTFLRAEAVRVKAAEAGSGNDAESDLWY